MNHKRRASTGPTEEKGSFEPLGTFLVLRLNSSSINFRSMGKRDSIQKGSEVSVRKRVTEEDINQFAQLSGDFAPNHVDEEFMRKSAYRKRIAHGALLVAYSSQASSMIIEEFAALETDATPISLGYDRIRFIRPVFIDDEIEIRYTVDSYDRQAARSNAKIEIKNQDDQLVAVATHIMKWVPNSEPGEVP